MKVNGTKEVPLCKGLVHNRRAGRCEPELAVERFEAHRDPGGNPQIFEFAAAFVLLADDYLGGKAFDVSG